MRHDYLHRRGGPSGGSRSLALNDTLVCGNGHRDGDLKLRAALTLAALAVFAKQRWPRRLR